MFVINNRFYKLAAMHQVVKVILVGLLAVAVVTSYLCYSDSTLILIHARQIEMYQTTLNEQNAYSNLHNTEIPVVSKELYQHNSISRRVVHLAKPVNITPKQSLTPDRGYIFPYSIYEEQTNGTRNLWQLQILAKQIGMQVVEPFAKDSFFTMNGIAPNFTKSLRFGDYVDKDIWNNMVTRDGGNPLVTWEEYITKAPC